MHGRPYVIFDLDGTIADCAWRQSYALEGNWTEFHELSKSDEVYPFIPKLVETLGEEYGLVIITGRNERWRSMTMQWLNDNRLRHFEELLMRPDDDYSPDVELKPRLAMEFFGGLAELRSMVAFALEDRDKMVVAWRDLGIPCFQVRSAGY